MVKQGERYGAHQAGADRAAYARNAEDCQGSRGPQAEPRIFQAAGNLPEAYEAFWAFYGPLKLEGLLEARLKELVRLKIAELNECAT